MSVTSHEAVVLKPLLGGFDITVNPRRVNSRYVDPRARDALDDRPALAAERDAKRSEVARLTQEVAAMRQLAKEAHIAAEAAATQAATASAKKDRAHGQAIELRMRKLNVAKEGLAAAYHRGGKDYDDSKKELESALAAKDSELESLQQGNSKVSFLVSIAGPSHLYFYWLNAD